MIGRHLGDVRILAEKAFEIASNGGHGIGMGPGEKMKEGFFFYGIYMSCNDLPINEAHECSVPVLTDPADSPPPILYETSVVAEGTANPSLIQFLI